MIQQVNGVPLGVPDQAPQFPWELISKAKQDKNQNQENRFDRGLQGFGQLGQAAGDAYQNNQIAKLLAQFRQNPMPQGQPQAQAPMPNPLQDAMMRQTGLANGPLSLMGQGPQQQGGGWTYVGPLGQ